MARRTRKVKGTSAETPKQAATAAASAVEPRIGASVTITGETYVIEAELGSGTFSTVYLAKNSAREAVAIKAMKYVKELQALTDATELEETLKRKVRIFEYEALRQKAAAMYGVAPRVFGTDRRAGLIAMEYLPPDKYLSLRRYVKSYDEELTHPLQLAILRAFATLQDISVYYRDENLADNIFLPISDGSDDVKVIDYSPLIRDYGNVWCTLFVFMCHKSGFYQFSQIAALMRDRPEWFGFPDALPADWQEGFEEFAEDLSSSRARPYLLDPEFEREAKRILQVEEPANAIPPKEASARSGESTSTSTSTPSFSKKAVKTPAPVESRLVSGKKRPRQTAACSTSTRKQTRATSARKRTA